MACEKNNTNSNIMKNLYGSYLSNDLATNAPIFSWASSQAMCTYNSMNSSDQAMEQPLVRGSHISFQLTKDMPDNPRGIFGEDNTKSSLHSLNEAPPCTEWEHPHFSHEDKSRIVTDRNILLGKVDLDPHADDDLQYQLEEYVNDLVPALHMVNKGTHNMNIAHRQEAIKLTADALLVRRATLGMAWSDALSKRVSNYCNRPQELEGIESLELAELAMAGPDYMECASSSCIRTPVSSYSEGTNSCEFSDHDFSAFHHIESTASFQSSDHTSMVDSTSDLLQDDMDVLNYVQSRVSLPLMDILSSSDAQYMSSVKSSGELLSMCKQGEINELKSESQLHEEINARLAMIRGCCKDQWNEDAKQPSNSALKSLQSAPARSTRGELVCTIKGLQHSCNASNIISSYISPKEHVFQYNTCNHTPADVKDYHLMRKHIGHDHYGVSHAGEGTKSLHVSHHDVPCRRRDDVAHSQQACYDLAAVSHELPCAGEHNGNVFHGMACGNADVARNVIHIPHDLAFKRADVAHCNSAAVLSGKAKQYEMGLGNADVEGGDVTGLQGMQMHDKVALDDVADEVEIAADDGNEEAEVEAKNMESDVEGGLQQEMTWQGSNMKQYRTTKDDVADEVANEGQLGADVEEGLRWKQGLTCQGSMYLATRDDVAGDVYGSEVDAGMGGLVRRGSHGGNYKMREMMYRVAAYQPIDWESIMEEGKERPKRRNVRISKEPQSVAARRRRERISERIRILQRLVPGTSKLDTASMLDEAIHYLKFLKLQVQALRGIEKFFTSQLPLSA